MGRVGEGESEGKGEGEGGRMGLRKRLLCATAEVVRHDVAASVAVAALEKVLRVLRSADGGGGDVASVDCRVIGSVLAEVLREAAHVSTVCRAVTRLREELSGEVLRSSTDETAHVFLELLALAAFPTPLKLRLLFAVAGKLAQHGAEALGEAGRPEAAGLPVVPVPGRGGDRATSESSSTRYERAKL